MIIIFIERVIAPMVILYHLIPLYNTHVCLHFIRKLIEAQRCSKYLLSFMLVRDPAGDSVTFNVLTILLSFASDVMF